MARKRASNQRKRAGQFRPPLQGDVFRDAPVSPSPKHTPDSIAENLDSTPLRDLIKLALSLGHDARVVCGVDSCVEHANWLPVTDRFATTSTRAGQYCYGIDIVWCRHCLSWYRDRTPQNLDYNTIIT